MNIPISTPKFCFTASCSVTQSSLGFLISRLSSRQEFTYRNSRHMIRARATCSSIPGKKMTMATPAAMWPIKLRLNPAMNLARMKVCVGTGSAVRKSCPLPSRVTAVLRAGLSPPM